jgi:LacI family transcriptional regulator
MSISAKELSKILNISEAAVSIALRDMPGVSTKTRQKVIETAEKHGYDFSKIVSAKKSTRHITFITYKRQGAVVSDTPFFSQLSEGIEKACAEAQYKLQITYFHKNDDIKSNLENIIYSDCAGIILLGTEMQFDDLQPFLKIPIPLVLLDVYFDFVEHDCVLINNVQGAMTATDFLISKTKKQPGYLRSSYYISNFDERADGFYKAVRKHGLSTSKSIVHNLTPSTEGAYADMLELLERNEEIASCYFADNDHIAIGAMKALQSKGYRIPDDISIIGFDNLPMSTVIEPPLATVHVPKQYMGELAVKRLIERFHAKTHSPVKIEVSTVLKKRRSVK